MVKLLAAFRSVTALLTTCLADMPDSGSAPPPPPPPPPQPAAARQAAAAAVSASAARRPLLIAVIRTDAWCPWLAITNSPGPARPGVGRLFAPVRCTGRCTVLSDAQCS